MLGKSISEEPKAQSAPLPIPGRGTLEDLENEIDDSNYEIVPCSLESASPYFKSYDDYAELGRLAAQLDLEDKFGNAREELVDLEESDSVKEFKMAGCFEAEQKEKLDKIKQEEADRKLAAKIQRELQSTIDHSRTYSKRDRKPKFIEGIDYWPTWSNGTSTKSLTKTNSESVKRKGETLHDEEVKLKNLKISPPVSSSGSVPIKPKQDSKFPVVRGPPPLSPIRPMLQFENENESMDTDCPSPPILLRANLPKGNFLY